MKENIAVVLAIDCWLHFSIVLGADIYEFWEYWVQIVWGKCFKLNSWLELTKTLGIKV